MNGSHYLKIFAGFLILIGLLVPSIREASGFQYDSKGKRDPFIPEGQLESVEKQLGASQLRLEGIILDPSGKSIAILNGEIVKEGDNFAGLEIKKIETNQVTFVNKEGEAFRVVLDRDDIMLRKYVNSLEGKETTPPGKNPPVADEATVGDATKLGKGVSEKSRQ